MNRTLAAGLLLLAASSAAARPPPVPEPAAQGTLQIGSLTLQACKTGGGYCGEIKRKLDPSGHVSGHIKIAFRFYTHINSGPAAGTIVAQEGGPGFPSIGSRAGYLALYAPLRTDHDLLMVDARGTGASGVIDCLPLQTQPNQTIAAVGACGRFLGAASVLYGTALAAADMVAVLDALGIGKIDYYGDSYGTFFGQTLAALYPNRIRSMVLDGAYPVIGESPWYPNAGAVIRTGFNLACQRTPYCAALPGTSLSRIETLMAALRQQPVRGHATDAEGQIEHAVADPSSIGLALYAGVSGPVNYRDLDAAIRALQDGDKAPLLRLVAENNGSEAPGPPRPYSRGLFAAVSCMDYQQIYDMNAPLKLRLRQRDAAIAAEQSNDPGIYDPLTITEFQTVPIDISVLNLCLRYPTKNPPYPIGVPIPPTAHFTQAPTLVINGELDMLTTPAEGAITTAEFPHAQQIIIANSFHVDAIYDVDDCTQNIVRRFTANLDTGDTSCAAAVKPVRLVPFFPRHAKDAIPATPASGNAATSQDRSLASAAIQTAGDAMARWYINYSGHDAGLRGGTWDYTQPGTIARYTLNAVRWTNDLPISGTLTWNQITGAVTTQLTFTADDGTQGTIHGAWNDHESYTPATLSGTVEGHTLQATMPAP
jgi:pimeloyl-ACP methyl ester carboxylesterase